MSEIVPIRKGIAPDPPAGTADEDVVQELKDLLAKAQAGEILGIAYATLCPGDLTTYYYVGRTTRGLLGTLSILQHNMCKNSLEDAE